MTIKRSLFSISLKNDKKFSQHEIDQLQHDFQGFLSLFVQDYLMPPITTNDNIFEVSFEENSRAEQLIENFLLHTNRYDQRYNLAFSAQELV